jgi:hypothetical protein
MATKRIGILTGGGDVPGLNSVIKSAVYRGSEIGYAVIGEMPIPQRAHYPQRSGIVRQVASTNPPSGEMASISLGIQASTVIEEEVIRILPNFGDAMDPSITALAVFMTRPSISHAPAIGQSARNPPS